MVTGPRLSHPLFPCLQRCASWDSFSSLHYLQHVVRLCVYQALSVLAAEFIKRPLLSGKQALWLWTASAHTTEPCGSWGREGGAHSSATCTQPSDKGELEPSSILPPAALRLWPRLQVTQTLFGRQETRLKQGSVFLMPGTAEPKRATRWKKALAWRCLIP